MKKSEWLDCHRKRVFPKTKGDSVIGQDRAQIHCDFRFSQIEKKILSRGVRLLTGMDRNAPEWASITGIDLKIHPKIHVLSVLDKKFWLSNVKYQISSVPRLF